MSVRVPASTRIAPPRPDGGVRHDRLDAWRGAAVVWMTVFHFCFDLAWLGWTRQNFYADPFWTWQRTAIVGLFLSCAGFSQAVAVASGQSWPRFWRRWAQIAACALLVSLGSLWMFPGSFIYFGVLHGLAVMLVVARLTAGWGGWLWLAGAIAIAMKFIATELHSVRGGAEFLNGAAWNWLGLVSRKPITEDYVPLVPWLGAVWWGLAAGQWVLRHRPQWLEGRLPAAAAPLTWLGRWSLTWYMLHQPVMIGALMAWRATG